MSNLIKIFLADDHLLLQDALAALINKFEGMRVIASANDGKQVIDQFSKGTIPDILLLDLNMPELDGFETAKIVCKDYPTVKILALTMYDSEIALIRLLQLGVKGFLKKDVHPKELETALGAISKGGYYYSHTTTGKLATLFVKNGNQIHNVDKAMLTDTEIQFLRLASTDLTYKEIAHQMKMTPRTIDNYRDHLFDKLDVRSRVGLAIYAIRNGLVIF